MVTIQSKKDNCNEKFADLPKTRKNIEQFLGLTGYYRRFIQNFFKIAKSLRFNI